MLLLTAALLLGSLELEHLPVNHAYGSALEQILQPAILEIEDSGGFSRPDPEKLSIYGDSWTWTRWRLDDLDISDPFDSGAAAVHVPWPFLRAIELDLAEDPAAIHGQGVRLRSAAGRDGFEAGATLGVPQVGGIFPLAYPIMRAVSGRHALDRPQAPSEDQRRRLDADLELRLADRRPLGDQDLFIAAEVLYGARKFLGFAPLTGALTGSYDEHYLIASAAARLEPRSKAWQATFLAEYRTRDRLGDELYYQADETARQDKLTLIAGISAEGVSAGLTLSAFRIRHQDLQFTREIFDPDGEGTHPWYPGGDYLAGDLDLTLRKNTFYLSSNHRFMTYAPERSSWSDALVAGGVPYGRIDWRSRSTAELIGFDKLGVSDQTSAGDLTLGYDLYANAAYAASAGGANSLAFAGVGLSAALSWAATAWLTPFFELARTPEPIGAELVRLLDPAYLEGSTFLASGGLIDTQGGGSIRVADRLQETAVYSASLGAKLRLGDRWSLKLMTLAKLDDATYRIAFDGPAGSTAGGIFYYADGPKHYVLQNLALGGPPQQPHYLGVHLDLLGVEEERWRLSFGFSVLAAIGVSAPGNGPTANDQGVVSFDSADPNSLIHGLADLDADRLYVVKALFSYQLAPGLWWAISGRYRDGQPFAFFNVYRNAAGQIALVNDGTRGSPWKPPPLSGPRKDLALNFDTSLSYTLGAVRGTLLVTNAFDFGTELAEVSGDPGKDSRAALELGIPRAVFLSIDAGF